MHEHMQARARAIEPIRVVLPLMGPRAGRIDTPTPAMSSRIGVEESPGVYAKRSRNPLNNRERQRWTSSHGSLSDSFAVSRGARDSLSHAFLGFLFFIDGH